MRNRGTAIGVNQEDGLRRQDALPGLCPLTEAVQMLATTAGVEARGAIYTRIEVVEFILDLAGYTSNRKLARYRILEPSFGGGDFLFPIIERLLKSWSKSKDQVSIEDLKTCVLAVELHQETFIETKRQVIELLQSYGLTEKDSVDLSDAWLLNDDFLLLDYANPFDFVVGNPPYVRQELIPEVLISEYRVRFETVYDRADLYIPFIEKSLKSLSKNGVLGFICADRWMKNKYGGPLRKLVSENYQLKYYVDMVDTEAFHSEVSAYPAIMVMSRDRDLKTRLAIRPEVQKEKLRRVAKSLTSRKLNGSNSGVLEMADVASGSEPWLLGEHLLLPLIRRLEAEFPALEDVGCKVGIGVATGADKAFISAYNEMEVEDDRKLPLAMTKDIAGGTVNWRGFGVINPYLEEGGLVDLDQYPKLKAFLEDRREVISKRHCARKTPSNWYKTIDRITPSLASMKKLLIPDIKGSANIVYEPGKLYPHHNLYYVISSTWNLRALQAVLLSDVTRAFIKTYSTQMRGGFLRYQAQYLRRIRLPEWGVVPKNIRKSLIEAANKRDVNLCNRAAYRLYRLSDAEIEALEE